MNDLALWNVANESTARQGKARRGKARQGKVERNALLDGNPVKQPVCVLPIFGLPNSSPVAEAPFLR